MQCRCQTSSKRFAALVFFVSLALGSCVSPTSAELSPSPICQGAGGGGPTLQKVMFLLFYDHSFYSNNAFRNPAVTEHCCEAASQDTSTKHFLLYNLLRTLPRSVFLHDPLGVHPHVEHQGSIKRWPMKAMRASTSQALYLYIYV